MPFCYLTKVAARHCHIVLSISSYCDVLISGTLLTPEGLLLPGLANTQEWQITTPVSESSISQAAKPELISQNLLF